MCGVYPHHSLASSYLYSFETAKNTRCNAKKKTQESAPICRSIHAMKTLISDIELFAAALAQVRVSICVRDNFGRVVIVNYGGPIERYTKVSVKVGGVNYARSMYEFCVS